MTVGEVLEQFVGLDLDTPVYVSRPGGLVEPMLSVEAVYDVADDGDVLRQHLQAVFIVP